MFLLRPANGISSLQAFFFSFFSLPEILVCSSVSYLEGGENQVKEKKGWGGGMKEIYVHISQMEYCFVL